jgi:hypothetical protein
MTLQRTREAAMIRQLARHRGGQVAALAQIIQMAREFDNATAAEMIDELASAHLAAGNLNLAVEARMMLADRYPGEPMAHRSILWLVRMYASSEVAHARRKESPGVATLRRQLPPEAAKALAEAPETIDKEKSATRLMPDEPDQLSLYALHLATQAMGRHAALAEDPALAFQRAVAARRAGQDKSAQAFLSPLKHRNASDPWGQCARAEAWLQESPGEASPKPVIRCRRAEAPPHLDGILDEPCWQDDGEPADPQATADVRWAHDGEYLYVSARCQKMAEVVYAVDDRPRPHDGDVEAHDRVRLLLDIDRDYASWFELVVDSRGWTADRCCGDGLWNPQWFVARGESAAGDAWTIEAAIPLKELAAKPAGSGRAWSCVVERYPPLIGQPVDGETSSAPMPGPAEFSLLLFE